MLERVGGDGRALVWGGDVDLNEIEQVIEGHVSQAAGEQDWEDAVFADGLVERGDKVFLGDGALLEVLFHQFVFAFGNQLDEGLVPGLGIGCQEAGNSGRNFAMAIAAGRVAISLHGDQVDYAVEALRVDDGELDRDDFSRPEGSRRASTNCTLSAVPLALGWSE